MLPVFLWILTSGENYFSVSISFQTPAANAPPANGPRITHMSILAVSTFARWIGFKALQISAFASSFFLPPTTSSTVPSSSNLEEGRFSCYNERTVPL